MQGVLLNQPIYWGNTISQAEFPSSIEASLVANNWAKLYSLNPVIFLIYLSGTKMQQCEALTYIFFCIAFNVF